MFDERIIASIIDSLEDYECTDKFFVQKYERIQLKIFPPLSLSQRDNHQLYIISPTFFFFLTSQAKQRYTNKRSVKRENYYTLPIIYYLQRNSSKSS